MLDVKVIKAPAPGTMQIIFAICCTAPGGGWN